MATRITKSDIDSEIVKKKNKPAASGPADAGSKTKRKRTAEPERKKRKSSRKKKHPVLIGLLIFIIAALIAAAVVVFGFAIRSTTIEGNAHVSDEEVLKVIGYDSCYGNSLLLWLKNRNPDLSDSQTISSVSVELTGPGKLLITVQEQVVTGCIEDDSKVYYVNANGYVILEDEKNNENVPVIEGISFSEIQINTIPEVSDEDAYNGLMDVAEYISTYDIPAKSISYIGDSAYSLTVSNVTVLLGRDTLMEEKISELSDLLSELTGRRGTLHLESYDSSDDSIIFTQDD